MAAAELIELFERVITLPSPAPTSELLISTIADVTMLEAVLASIKTRVLAELAAVSPSAEVSFAQAARVSLGQADRVLKRGVLLASVQSLADAFAEGRLSVDHVDAFGTIYRRSSVEVRAKLVEHAVDLVAFGETATEYEFRRHVAAKAREFESAEDAEERLIRQQKAVRLSLRMDPDSGMGRISGSFDPETFQWLHGHIIRETQTRFHDLTPEHCPLDPLERQQFLRAHALIALLTGEGNSAAGGRPEIVIVHHQPGQDVTINWGIAGLELPDSSLDRILANKARIFNITIRNGDIISAPGELNLGRNARLANRAQRRALAAIHDTCAVPGCEVRYWQTKLHHIQWWEHGGLTNLNNLIPLCSHHHARLHADHWKCELKPGRQVVFTLPDGTILANAPPHTMAA